MTRKMYIYIFIKRSRTIKDRATWIVIDVRYSRGVFILPDISPGYDEEIQERSSSYFLSFKIEIDFEKNRSGSCWAGFVMKTVVRAAPLYRGKYSWSDELVRWTSRDYTCHKKKVSAEKNANVAAMRQSIVWTGKGQIGWENRRTWAWLINERRNARSIFEVVTIKSRRTI